MTRTETRNQTAPDIWAAFDPPNLAYIKPIKIDGELLYAIHAADGSELGVSSSRDVAFAAARQHDLDPVSVH